VSKAIFPFKVVVTKEIILWYVTIIANSHFSVGTVKPGCILGSHNMTVHAGIGRIRQVGIGSGDVKHICSKTEKDSHCNNNRNFPILWWYKKP